MKAREFLDSEPFFDEFLSVGLTFPFFSTSFIEMKGVAHPLLFCHEVALVVGVGLHLDGHVLHDFQSVGFESNALDGVVRQQTYLAHSELAQDLCADAVLPLVGAEAQMHVGLHGVVALFLEFVGLILLKSPMPRPSWFM